MQDIGSTEHASASAVSESVAGMEAQLCALYAEREILDEELGISDATEIVGMVRSLEAQLHDLYQEKEEHNAL